MAPRETCTADRASLYILHTNSVEICSLAGALSAWVWAKLQAEVQLAWPNAERLAIHTSLEDFVPNL